ncbi:hypothetical protein SCAR479_05301 [Seiridium cardinale]|uniref:Protein kinase domain-containing protein n=1 Tax=Seiridium cardinale TaxID=138064 RepID=A0ABR2XVY7_9PEZI
MDTIFENADPEPTNSDPKLGGLYPIPENSESEGDYTAEVSRYVHRSPLRGNVTFHGHQILATNERIGFENILRVQTRWDRIVYIINVVSAFEVGFQYRANSHLLDDIPQIPIETEKYFWLALHEGSKSAFTPRTTGTPDVCDSVENVDHPVKINCVELTNVPSTVEDYVQDREPYWSVNPCTVTHPSIEGKMVCRIVEFPECLYRHPLTYIKKDVRFNCLNTPLVSSDPQLTKTRTQIMERQIKIHQELARHGLAPEFLGLVTEEGRGVIGYLSRFIEDAKTLRTCAEEWDEESAGEDIETCSQLVRSLHKLDIVHGDLHKQNILRRTDGSMLLIDFEDSCRSDEYKAFWFVAQPLEEEYESIMYDLIKIRDEVLDR